MAARHSQARHWTLVAVGLALALTTAACGSAAPAPADEAAAPVTATGQDGLRGLQYGDRIEQYASTLEHGAEPQLPTDRPAGASPSGRSEYVPTAWDDLVPPGTSEEEIAARYSDRLNEVEAGSDEVMAIYREMQAELDPEAVNPQMDGQRIRLVGFVAPLTWEEDVVTEFLLVPSFGACIHVPPPPPNQTVLVSVSRADGLTVEDVWGAVWVEGTITVAPATTDLAAASYTVVRATSGVYEV